MSGATRGEQGTAPAASRGRRGLSALSAVLIVLGLLLGTASVVTSYAKAQLTDTEGFVTAFAPLAADRDVQDVVSDAVTQAVQDAVDIPALTAQVFDGIRALDLPAEAASALTLLEGPTVQGLTSLIGGMVRDLVASDAFAEIWKQTLRVSHSQVVATLSGAENAAVTIGTDGGLELQLGPIVDAVRDRLSAEGMAFASVIPDVDQSIVLVPDAELGQVATGYALLVGVATWLPWIAIALLAAGVLTARHRRRTLIATSVAAVVLMLVLGAGLAVGRAVLRGQIIGAGGPVTASAGGVVFDAATDAMAQLALAIGVLAASVVLVAWISGPARAPQAIRAAVARTAASSRSDGAAHEGAWHAVGVGVARWHAVILIVIAVIASAVILLIRPLSAGIVIATALSAGVLVVALQFARREES